MLGAAGAWAGIVTTRRPPRPPLVALGHPAIRGSTGTHARGIRGRHDVVSRYRAGGARGQPGRMNEVLRIVLGGLVVASLTVIVAYVLGFVSVVVATVLASRRRDPLAEELDQMLAGLLGKGAVGPRDASKGSARSRHHPHLTGLHWRPPAIGGRLAHLGGRGHR